MRDLLLMFYRWGNNVRRIIQVYFGHFNIHVLWFVAGVLFLDLFLRL